MPITDDKTPNFAFQLPHATNNLDVDVERLRQSIQNLDTEIKTISDVLDTASIEGHGHDIAEIIGLQAKITQLEGVVAPSLLDDLSDVDAGTTANGHVLLRQATSWISAQLGLGHIDQLTEALNGKLSTSSSLGTLQDVSISDVADGQILQRVSGAWQNVDGGFVPVGASILYNGASAPAGYLKENGATISRTAYAALFAAIGTTFGSGDGSTTFKLPDSRGEFLRGLDDGRGVDAGRSLGVWQADQNKAHQHGGSVGNGGGHGHTASSGSAGSHGHTGSTGSAGNHKHNVEQRTGYAGSRNAPIQTPNGANANGTTDYAGTHTHSLSINSGGAHTHTVSVGAVGDHSHSLTINSDGGSEARPRNQAKLMCIKY